MTKAKKIIYWVATLWLALGMTATAFGQLFKLPGQGGPDMITHLGYPVYVLTILGVWKILGVIAVLLKEWAYAGFVFIMSGAIFSHVAVGDPGVEVLPGLLLLVLTVVSWSLRPESRKLVSIAQ